MIFWKTGIYSRAKTWNLEEDRQVEPDFEPYNEPYTKSDMSLNQTRVSMNQRRSGHQSNWLHTDLCEQTYKLGMRRWAEAESFGWQEVSRIP